GDVGGRGGGGERGRGRGSGGCRRGGGDELVERLFIPRQPGLGHRGRIGEARQAAGFSADDLGERRTEAVLAGLGGVTRRAGSLEGSLPRGGIAGCTSLSGKNN